MAGINIMQLTRKDNQQYLERKKKKGIRGNKYQATLSSKLMMPAANNDQFIRLAIVDLNETE